MFREKGQTLAIKFTVKRATHCPSGIKNFFFITTIMKSSSWLCVRFYWNSVNQFGEVKPEENDREVDRLVQVARQNEKSKQLLSIEPEKLELENASGLSCLHNCPLSSAERGYYCARWFKFIRRNNRNVRFSSISFSFSFFFLLLFNPRE